MSEKRSSNQTIIKYSTMDTITFAIVKFSRLKIIYYEMLNTDFPQANALENEGACLRKIEIGD